MPDSELSPRGRWLAFAILCLGNLMIVLDSTIVNVALPSVRADLGFSAAALAWVVNAYLLTFGGFLLLGGRLADIYGQRLLFLGGVVAFTVSSLACGLAPDRATLVVARAVQGLGGAVVSAVALSLIMILFPEGPGRVRAMGYFGFVMSGGGSIGVLLGGLITGSLNWRWVFLVNIPIGVGVFFAALRLVPKGGQEAGDRRLDIAGALTVTASLLAAVYAIIGAEQAGWSSAQTLGLLAAAAVLMAAFLVIESRVGAPLVPLGLFKLRNLRIANLVAILWAAAMFAWFFLSALYLQQVLRYTPMQVGLAFLPADLIMGAFSYRLAAMTVERFGIRAPMAVGLAIAAVGLALFALAPVDGRFLIHVLPGMVLLGLGSGLAFNPVMLAATNDVEPRESGLASGVLNTAFMMGGALGLSILASLAAAVSRSFAHSQPAIDALNRGYQAAFWAGAVCATVAALLGGIFLRPAPLRADALPPH
jgi:EmrB/QacA subfamily drug resistance transporter